MYLRWLSVWFHFSIEKFSQNSHFLNHFLLLFCYSRLNFSPFALLHPPHPALPQSIPTDLSYPITVSTVMRSGDLKTLDDNNYVHRPDRKRSDTAYWKCELKENKARLPTILENENASVFVNSSASSHPSQPSKPKVYQALTDTYKRWLLIHKSLRALIIDSLVGDSYLSQ